MPRFALINRKISFVFSFPLKPMCDVATGLLHDVRAMRFCVAFLIVKTIDFLVAGGLGQFIHRRRYARTR